VETDHKENGVVEASTMEEVFHRFKDEKLRFLAEIQPGNTYP
jgi:hypothetical protein